MFSLAKQTQRSVRWQRPRCSGAGRRWPFAAALAALLAVPLTAAAATPSLAAPATAARPATPSRPAARTTEAALSARSAPAARSAEAALSARIARSGLAAPALASYGVGGVPPISVGYTAESPQSVAVDPVTGTVFTADPLNDTVQVISESTESVAESISLPGAPIALAVDPVSGTVYVGETTPEVQVITENPSNPSQDAVTSTVSIPQNQMGFGDPEGIGVVPGATPDTGTVYVTNASGSNVAVVSEATNSITNTIQIPELPAGTNGTPDPVGVAVDSATGNVFLADYDDGYISVISGASYLGSFPLSSNPGEVDPTGIAADPVTGTVYVTAPLVGPQPDQGELYVIQENAANPAASTVAATIAVPAAGTSGATSGYPDAVAVNPNTATVYVTNEEGAVDVMDEDTANPADDAFSTTPIDVGGNGVPVLYGAAADTSTGNAWSGAVYVASNQNDDLYAISPQAISFTAPSCPSPGCEATHKSTLAATGGSSGNPVVFSVPSSSSSVCSLSGTTGTTLNYLAPGTCVVDANQAGSNFYLAAPQVSVSITVLPGKTQTITWTPPSTSYWGPATGYYGATVTLKATATSSLPVVFSVDSTSQPGVCSVSGTSGTTLTYNTLGTCVIDANQAGNSTYLPAPQVQVSIMVDAAPQTITFKPPATGVVGKTVTLTATGGGSGNPVMLIIDPSTNPAVCNLSGANGTTVSFTAVGNCIIDANQQGSTSPPYDYMPAQPVQGLITVGIAPTFVQADPPLSAEPQSEYNYAFVASGIPAPTYALGPGAPSWLSINPSTGLVTGTVPAVSGYSSGAPAPTYSYTVTATNKYGTATSSRYVVLPAAPAAGAVAAVASGLSCYEETCTLTVTNSGPATQVVVSEVLPAALSPSGQICPNSWGCFSEANTISWSLGAMAPGTQTFTLYLGVSGSCGSSGCPVEVAAGTPGTDNSEAGYSTGTVTYTSAPADLVGGLPIHLRRPSG